MLLPAPPTDPIITPARTPWLARGLGTLGAMTGDLVGGDEALEMKQGRAKRRSEGGTTRNGIRQKDNVKREVRGSRQSNGYKRTIIAIDIHTTHISHFYHVCHVSRVTGRTRRRGATGYTITQGE